MSQLLTSQVVGVKGENRGLKSRICEANCRLHDTDNQCEGLELYIAEDISYN
jgi:hypothetical protein